jgi:beta-galactosidase
MKDGTFWFDGDEFQLISGAIHYFRVPREYWHDRLEKLIALGCNAVETYVPWNLHEPKPSVFDFKENLDIEAFIGLAGNMGLKAIVRPSPYICGEFEFGGQPWWLLRDPLLRVRTTESTYREAVHRYYRELIPRLAKLQCGRGGPIIACQIENEYGYYGNDKDYLTFIRNELTANGIEVLLFTTDGPWGEALEAGSLEGVLSGGSFGTGASEHFIKMRAMRPGDPFFCSEFWMGWFDAWGEEHHARDFRDAAASLDEILERGHVNLYMFHGGTNFGFTSGANHYEELKPDVTSYDYDAPLSECGDVTPKYLAFREVISRRVKDTQIKTRLSSRLDDSSFSTKIDKKAFGALAIDRSVSLDATLEGISSCRWGKRPLGMEEMDQGYGYVLYRCRLAGPKKIERFVLWNCHDRVVVYVNGFVAATQVGNEIGKPLSLDIPLPDNRIEILVENQGRVNFGEKMNDQRKGLLGALVIDKHAHCDIESWSLPLDDLSGLHWESGYRVGTAAFHHASFPYEKKAGVFHDSFLRLDGWGKGVAWANGFNLGRFWSIGPQRTLYLPGSLLHDGENDIILFETEGRAARTIELTDRPYLG